MFSYVLFGHFFGSIDESVGAAVEIVAGILAHQGDPFPRFVGIACEQGRKNACPVDINELIAVGLHKGSQLLIGRLSFSVVGVCGIKGAEHGSQFGMGREKEEEIPGMAIPQHFPKTDRSAGAEPKDAEKRVGAP